MKKLCCLIMAIAIMMFIAGCTMIKPEETLNCESKDMYTHEELTALPAEQLLQLFVDNGLIINDSLKTMLSKEELQTLFKSEFDSLCRGISTRGDLMYFDLARETKEIYKKLTGQD